MSPHPWQFLPLRWSITHSLNVLSCPRRFQLHFPLPRSFAYSLNVASCPWQFLPLRQSITHFLNVLSCPRQFQFIFPAPAVNHILLECHFTFLAISISIPCFGGHSYIP